MTQAELRKRRRKGKKVGKRQNRKMMRLERKRTVRDGNRVSVQVTTTLLSRLIAIAKSANLRNIRPTKESLAFARLLQEERKLTPEKMDRVAILACA